MSKFMRTIKILSIMLNVLVLNGPPNQTTSANCGGKMLRGEKCVLCFIIHIIIDTIFPNHCWRAYKKYMSDKRKGV